jgi:hypothetical protein
LKRVAQVVVGENHTLGLVGWTVPPLPDADGRLPGRAAGLLGGGGGGGGNLACISCHEADNEDLDEGGNGRGFSEDGDEDDDDLAALLENEDMDEDEANELAAALIASREAAQRPQQAPVPIHGSAAAAYTADSLPGSYTGTHAVLGSSVPRQMYASSGGGGGVGCLAGGSGSGSLGGGLGLDGLLSTSLREQMMLEARGSCGGGGGGTASFPSLQVIAQRVVATQLVEPRSALQVLEWADAAGAALLRTFCLAAVLRNLELVLLEPGAMSALAALPPQLVSCALSLLFAVLPVLHLPCLCACVIWSSSCIQVASHLMIIARQRF